MNDDIFAEIPPSRPLWLITLADLALLLVGFLVLVQATTLDRDALAQGIREGFGVPADTAPLPVSNAAVTGFAVGSSALPAVPAGLIAWAREAARDPRVALSVTGMVDGSPGDADAVSGSGTMLAVDRARAVAAVLIAARVIAPERITITNSAATGGRRVAVGIAFAGEPKDERR